MKDNINELIYRYFQKDEEALAELIAMLRPGVMNVYQKKMEYKKTEPVYREEFLSMADLLLVDCLEKYRYDHKVSFLTFYLRALHNRLIDAGRTAFRNDPLLTQGHIVYLDRRPGEDASVSMQDLIEDRSASSGRLITSKISLEMALEKIDLKPLQKQAVQMYLDGYSQREIARHCGCSIKSIRRLLEKFEAFSRQELTVDE